jgi:glycerol uptake facilitator-like aquaporin
MNKYFAELLGTFALALAVDLSLAGKFPVPTPVIAALTLGVCVYTLGAISGAHLNPAITLGLLTVGKISLKDAAGYLAAQFAGAGLAILGSSAVLGTRPEVKAVDSLEVFRSEFAGAFWLAVGVASVVYGKTPGPAAGLTIGGSFLLGISIAAPGSNGVLNPALALAIGSFSLTYLLAPIGGAILAALVYRRIAGEG